MKMKDTEAVKIYLAGKVSKHDWRHHQDVAGYALRGHPEVDDFETLPTWNDLPLDNFVMTGPFFTSDDHGCGHGDNLHGVGAGRAESSGKLSSFVDENTGGCVYSRRDHVVSSCFDAIDRSDVVFVWLGQDADTAYGTLVEVGYAVAKKKTVVICSNSPIADEWFAYAAADHVLIGSSDAPSAFQEVLRRIERGSIRP